MHLTSSLPLFEGRLSPNWLHTGFRLAKSRGRVSLVRQPSYAKDEGHKSNLPPHNNNIHRSHRPQLAASDPTNLFILHTGFTSASIAGWSIPSIPFVSPPSIISRESVFCKKQTCDVTGHNPWSVCVRPFWGCRVRNLAVMSLLMCFSFWKSMLGNWGKTKVIYDTNNRCSPS